MALPAPVTEATFPAKRPLPLVAVAVSLTAMW
jgi:hypothetical protein